MTNAFGPIYGTAGGVTTIKENGYYSDINLDEVLKTISGCGFKSIEIFEVNLLSYKNNISDLKEMLNKYAVSIISVYVGCQFIYEDVLADELAKVEEVCKVAKEIGAKYIVFGGGALRSSGIQADDYLKLAKGVDKAADICKKYGLHPSFHPHLGSLVQSSDQIDKFFSLSKIDFCPDLAHLFAGGSDPLALVKKYYNRIKFVHLKDISKSGEFYPLGKGVIDLKGVIRFLKEKKYEGDWVVEIDGYPGDSQEACATSYRFISENI
jgi:inosose dehydratase